jgi:formylmethanofuran dehydrogenase subunit B
MVNLVCTGCGSLCDDIQVEIEENHIARIENACAKGAAFLYALDNPERRTTNLVRHEEVPLERAIEEAKHLLFEAKRPLIFGLDNSTLEAQAKAIRLARKLGAVIDDASSYSYGELIRGLMEGSPRTCSLSQIKDKADLLIYWGSNPLHSHPRHLSEFSYYAYTDYDEAGWVPKVKMTCVDVRETELSSICRPAFRLAPGGDREFIQETVSIIKGGKGTEEAKAFLELIKNSQVCVIFCGKGLVYSVNGNLDSFNEMVEGLSQWTKVSVIPMIDEINMLGFNKSLREETGYINQVSFDGGIIHGTEFSFLEQVHKGLLDCVLIAGSDPFSTLPQSLSRKLASTKIICLSNLITPTTDAAEVVIATAAPGLESSGKVVRMDEEESDLLKVKKSTYPSEEEVLERFFEDVK